MTVHSDGSGTSWDELAPDIDQAHGLDYRELQDIRKGVRKRINKEHVAFADNTVGGDHIPGKVSVVDQLDSTSDFSNYFDDGSYTGSGLVWCISTGTAYGALFICSTTDGTYTGASGDPTFLKLHPDVQWGGGDITWKGAHEFDASVDISGNVAIDGDFSVDGTAVFDATGVEFGGTAGIGLFYDPTVYAGGESMTFPNGLIRKQGYKVAAVAVDVSFAAPFPTAIDNIQLTTKSTTGDFDDYQVDTGSEGVTGFIAQVSGTTNLTGFWWIAEGY